MDEAHLVRLGIFDPDTPDAGDRRALLEQVIALGATDAELVDAEHAHTLGVLALELAMRSPGRLVDFSEASTEAGLDRARAARVWRAIGFPDPEIAPPRLAPDEVEVLRLVAMVDTIFGSDAMLAVTRVLGTLTARLAEAIVDAFRTEFEVPQLGAGVPYSQVVKRYVELSSEFPAFIDAFGALFRRHLMVVATGAWSVDEEAATTRRDLVVGFADIVGYTSFSSTLSPRRLASLVTRLEDAASDLAAQHKTRVVKLIGDGAMFASESPIEACQLALALVDRFAHDAAVPPLRVALAAGPVVSVHGDYFGEVVNTAARLLAVAAASEIVVTERLGDLVQDAFVLEPLPSQSLKGIPVPAHPYRLLRRS